jgi:hypothetical protein
VLVDRSTLEVYADGGSRVLSANVFPFMNTTMSSAVGAGATFMPVQSTANFQVGQTLRVNADANGPLPGMTEHTITAVGTSSLNFLPPLATSGAAGTPVSTPLATGVEAFASGGTATITAARIWNMKSIWR